MKTNLHKGFFVLLTIIIYASACKKSIDASGPNPAPTPHDTTSVSDTPPVPFPIVPLLECNSAPYYGDSIVYAQPAGTTDFYVYPQTNQGVTGTYLSWPQGLALNPNTGAIDLTLSQTGQRYAVGFVKSGTTDTCMSQLIVGGAAYMDSVYVLAQSDTTSRPYFDANPTVGSPCGSGGPGPGCQFDYNNYAKNQGIIVNKQTGFIDLKKTTQKINFSTLINGESMITNIYYKLNDKSNSAPQMIQIKLVYYVHKSDIPPNVLAQINQSLYNTMNDLLISKGASPRPPIIIITRFN